MKRIVILTQVLALFIIALSFIAILEPNQYADNNKLITTIQKNPSELSSLPHVFFLKIYNFSNNLIYSSINKKDYLSIKETQLSDLNRYFFFSLTFIIILVIISIEYIKKHIVDDKNFKIISFFLTCLCFPTAILSIISFSGEAIFTILIIYLTIIISRKFQHKYDLLFIPIILFYSFKMDSGNFWVFNSFIFGLTILFVFRYYLNLKQVLLIVFISLIIIFYGGSDLFLYFGSFIDSYKVHSILADINYFEKDNLSLIEKFSRFSFFGVSLISLYLADHKLTYFSFPFILFLMTILYVNLKIKNIEFQNLKLFFLDKYNQILYIYLFLFAICITHILPLHSYAKYYLFYIVFILKPLIVLFGEKNTFLLVVIYSSLSIIEHL